jgi:hypothetical protein
MILVYLDGLRVGDVETLLRILLGFLSLVISFVRIHFLINSRFDAEIILSN